MRDDTNRPVFYFYKEVTHLATQTVNMSTYSARILAHTPNDTSYFLRGDNTFTNILSCADSETIFTVQNSSSEIDLSLKIDNTNTIHGLYSSGYYNGTTTTVDGKWLIQRNSDGSIDMNGNSATTTKLKTAVNVWGQSFDGSSAVTGNMSGWGGTIWAAPNVSEVLFLTSGSGALNGKFGKIGLADSYASIDLATYRFHCVGNAYVTARLYCGEWIQFYNWTGLYSANNGAHFYPNNVSTYGTWNINGSRNGYIGINFGPTSSYMTVMCDSGGNGGIFHEGCFWSLYTLRTGRMGLMGSDTSSGFTVQVNGSLYTTGSVSFPGGSFYVRAQNGTNEGGEIYLAAAPSYGYYACMDVNNASWRIHSNGTTRFSVNLQTGSHSDYAEDRTAETHEPGRVYRETNECILVKTNKRLIPGCSVCSDTYGTSIPGDEDGIPFAVSGRVLVYPEGDRNNYTAGQAVCCGPNGTVTLMTREEIKEYPDCILGYTAGIPDEKTWSHPTVELKGRIWIRLA